jgi:hypothetical protein
MMTTNELVENRHRSLKIIIEATITELASGQDFDRGLTRKPEPLGPMSASAGQLPESGPRTNQTEPHSIACMDRRQLSGFPFDGLNGRDVGERRHLRIAKPSRRDVPIQQ